MAEVDYNFKRLRDRTWRVYKDGVKVDQVFYSKKQAMSAMGVQKGGSKRAAGAKPESQA